MSTNGDLLTIDGRATLRFERHYRHPVERVWRAVTEPSEMAAWFPSQVIGDRVVGADLIFDDDAKRAAARAAGEPTRDDGPWFHGTVVAFEPPALFEFTWGGELLRIELTPEGDGTRMVFSQVVSHPSVAARNGAGWHVCLTELDALLDPPARPAGDGDSDGDSGARADADDADDGGWRDVYEDYLRRMGPALGVPTSDGGMTWERATHVDAERVRVAVSDPDEIGAWGAGDQPTDGLRWEVEPADHGTAYRLTHRSAGGDAVLAATWHALLIQLDMYLAAGQLVPVDAGEWVEAYRRAA